MDSISKAGFSSESPEESGWTTHFDDFSNNHKSSSSISSINNNSSSLLSDDTSLYLAATKVTYSTDGDQTREEEFCVNKNVNLRKRKKPQAVHLIIDHQVLEDTASSPLIHSFKKKGSSSAARKELCLKGRHST